MAEAASSNDTDEQNEYQISLDQPKVAFTIDGGAFRERLESLSTVDSWVRIKLDADGMVIETVESGRSLAGSCNVEQIEYQTDPEDIELVFSIDELTGKLESLPTDDTTVVLDDGSSTALLRDDTDHCRVPVRDSANYKQLPEIDEPDEWHTTTVDAMRFYGAVGAVAAASEGTIRLTMADDTLWAEGGRRFVEDEEEFEHDWDIDAEVDTPSWVLLSDEYVEDLVDGVPATGKVEILAADNVLFRLTTEAGVTFYLSQRVLTTDTGSLRPTVVSDDSDDVEKEPATDGGVNEAIRYQCNNDDLCGSSFDTPDESPDGLDICPHCGTTNIQPKEV